MDDGTDTETDWDAESVSANVDAGVSAITDSIEVFKDDSTGKAKLIKLGAAIKKVGAVAALMPAPGGLAVGGVLMGVGSLLPLFGGPKPPSDEAKLLKEVNQKLDKVVKMQQKMFEKIDKMGLDVIQLKYSQEKINSVSAKLEAVKEH